MVNATYALVAGQELFARWGFAWLYPIHLTLELGALTTLAYCLLRQGRTPLALGLTWRWSDLGVTILLLLISHFVHVASHYALSDVYYTVTGRVLDLAAQRPITPAGEPTIPLSYPLLVLVNPIFEELVERGYVISELRWLTKRPYVGVVANLVINRVSHLYQGPLAVLRDVPLTLLWSWYYVRWHRLTPLILMHLVLDMNVIVYYLVTPLRQIRV